MANQITPNPSVPSQVVAEVKFPQVIQNLGIIPTSYKDSMSYYETLAWLCKYLEEIVIPSVNQNGNAVQELQNLYIDLNSYVTHYFDNLDVQQEINNKLDDMVTSGVFENTLSIYFNSLENQYNQKYNEIYTDIHEEIENLDSDFQNNIDELKTKINSVVSTPVFAVSSTSEMTDTSKVYVNTTDGKWYYYNDTNWVAGGTYQSNVIANNSIDVGKTNFIQTGDQLFDRNDLLDNTRISFSTGVTSTNSDYKTSNFAPVNPGDSLYPNNVYRADLCYFDQNKTFVSGVNLLNTDAQTVPSGVYYIRCSVQNSQCALFSIGKRANVQNSPFYYQIPKLSKPIKENEIKPYNCEFITEGINKFNSINLTEGKFLNYSNGFENTNVSFCYSDFQRCKPSTTYYVKNGLDDQICFFDENKNYVGGALVGADLSFTTNANTYFYIISLPISRVSSTMVCENSSELENYIPYSFSINGLNNNVFYVGSTRSITSLKEGIETVSEILNATLYVDPGTYDLIDEFGSSYFENFNASQSNVGLVLKNNIHVIFSPQAKVVCNYEGDNTYVKQRFAPFNSGVLGFTIENLNLECSNVRYAIHDDRGNGSDFYKNHYINCNIFIDNSANLDWGSTQCIGGGLAYNGEVIIENCVFRSYRSTYTINNAVSYHNCAFANAQSKITIKDCYFKDENSIRISQYGVSTKKTDVIITNNRLGHAIDLRPETEESTTENFNVMAWNNLIELP